MSLTELPAETLVAILSFTNPIDVRRCQQVCRKLRDLVATDAHLQYILELDAWGYAPPSVPRSDLSYDEMIRVLRDRRERRKRNQLVQPAFIQFAPGRTDQMCFADGVLAYVCTNPKFPQRRLQEVHFDQLASVNKGTEHKHWCHHMDFSVSCFAIQPEDDLLILLEVEKLDGAYSYRLHFRTMSTNEPHPAATFPLGAAHTLNVGSVSWGMRRPYRLEPHGRLVAIQFRIGPPLQRQVLIFDWIEGLELGRITLPFLNYFWSTYCLLSQEFLITPRVGERFSGTGTRDDAGTKVHTGNGLGTLELYKLPVHRRGTHPQTIHHIASFELPDLQSAGCIGDTLRMRVYCADVASTPAAVYEPTYPRRPAKIYGPNPANCLVCVHISNTIAVEDGFSGHYEEWLIGNVMNGSGALFVSPRVLLDTLAKKSADLTFGIDVDHCTTIPWESWGNSTSWFTPPVPISHSPWFMEGREAATIRISWQDNLPVASLLVLNFNQNRAQNQLASGSGVEQSAGPATAGGGGLWGMGDLTEDLAQAFLGMAVAAVPQESIALMPMEEDVGIEDDFRRTMVGGEHVVVFGQVRRRRETSRDQCTCDACWPGSPGFFVYKR